MNQSDDLLIWSTSDKARARATALFVIRAIVERHHGTVENIDLATWRIDIDVPEEERDACVMEIERQVGAMVC